MPIAATVNDAFPLAALQAGMLFHSQLEIGASTYHDILSLRITGPFNHGALDRVLKALTAGHEILRVAMDIDTFSEPMQLVHSVAETPLTVEDLRSLPDQEQQPLVAAWRAGEKSRSFDLSQAPLLRIHAQRLTDISFWLNISFHHAILDGWSLSLLTSRLLSLYDQALTGHEPAVPPLRSHFRDYVSLERAARAETAAQEYWRGVVEHAPVLDLPRWRDPGRLARHAVQRYEVPLADDLTPRIRDLAAQAGVTPKAVLFAAHASVLALLSGQDKVVTGRVSNGRPEMADSDQVLGVFLNTLPMVVSTRRGSWLDLARQVHQDEVASMPFRRYPLAGILHDSHRDTLFETLVDYRHMRSYASMPLSHLAIDSAEFFEQTNFPFVANFQAAGADGIIRLRLDYDVAEFPAAQIEAIAGYYTAALNAATSDPTSAVAGSMLVGAKERTKVLVEWNKTALRLPVNPVAPDLLVSAAERHPNRNALRYGDQVMTYQELNAKANRLAWLLQERGARPDTVIGIHMRRTPDLVVAVLAVLKAGATYLPLDPGYPADRLVFMLADSRAAIVITDSRLTQALATDATVVAMDEANLQQYRDNEPSHRLRPEHLAYVIYTSGSTGRPKGVQIPHRALVNLLLSMSDHVGLTATDRWLATTSLSFDISALELFAPLVAGAELVLMPEVAGDGAAMLSAVRSSAATIIQATPSAWQLLIETGIGANPELRAVCGGEAMSHDLARQLTARFRSVWNVYGPTETTIWSCLHPVLADEPVSIGGPLGNTEVYVLGPDLQPVPIGVPGELYIGGEGLARGYHNKAGQTATRFISSRWGRPGSRLFRTGDIARWQPNGQLEFLGRSDHQVKIRGHRIELGEIGAVLGEHPAVRQAVVVVSNGVTDQKLSAYLTTVADKSPQGVELRRYLEARLPDYMVPTSFVVLDELPLTPNGKIDRRALPEPRREDAGIDAFTEPATQTERALAELWSAELGIDRIGAEDTFRALGGHSLEALRLITRINKLFGSSIPLGSLLTGTLRSLADTIDNKSGSVGQLLVPLRKGPGWPPRFIIHALGGGIFGYTALADALPIDQPLYGFQAFEFAGISGPHPVSIEAIAEYYLRELRAVQPHGPYHLTGWCLGGVLAYEMARQLQQQGGQIGTLALISSSIDDPVPPEYADDQVAVLFAAFEDHLTITKEELRELDPNQRLRLVVSALHQSGERPDLGSIAELGTLVRTYQRHSRAVLAYRDQMRSGFCGDVLLIRADSGTYPEGDLGWGPRVEGKIIIVKTPGDHHSMLSKANVESLGRLLAIGFRDGVHAVGQLGQGNLHTE